MATTVTYDSLVDRGVFQKNHLDDNAGFNGLMYETYGAEAEAVRQMAIAHPDRVATIIDCDGKMYLTHRWHFVNRMGYFIATRDVPDFGTLLID